MFLDLTFITLFVTSSIALWYRFSEKIPEVVAIPDEVIIEELRKDSKKFHIQVLSIKALYNDLHYKDFFLRQLAKILYRIHILILRLDNRMVSLISKFRNGNGSYQNDINGLVQNGLDRKEYWKTLNNTDTGAGREHKLVEGIKTKLQ